MKRIIYNFRRAIRQGWRNGARILQRRSAPPPPRIEDYPGDPEGFRRDAAAWASAYGVDNRRIEKKYSEGTPTDEERERILKAMGH